MLSVFRVEKAPFLSPHFGLPIPRLAIRTIVVVNGVQVYQPDGVTHGGWWLFLFLFDRIPANIWQSEHPALFFLLPAASKSQPQ
jgi:hypothetical protein